MVRYAETRGHEFDYDTPGAHHYRDYVVRAFGDDVPYDQFVREHIAGDLIDPRIGPGGINESVLGTGFWFLGPWVHSPVDTRKDEADRFDDMVDVATKAFLGLTVACARCHDHKFDAISAADYHALCGYLQSSDYRQVRFDSMVANRKVADQLRAVDDRYINRIESLLRDAGLKRPVAPEPPIDDRVIIDYGRPPAGGFIADGYVFGDKPLAAGSIRMVGRIKPEIRVVRHASAATDAFWSDLKTVREETIKVDDAYGRLPSSGRRLRTPTFELTDGLVHCRVRGRGHVFACVDSHRLVKGPLHKETIQSLSKPKSPESVDRWRWFRMDLSKHIGRRIHLEFIPEADTDMAVQRVVLGDPISSSESSNDEVDEYGRAVEALLNDASKRSSIAEPVKRRLLSLVRNWFKERNTLRRQVVSESRTAPAMVDGFGEDDRILVRGNVDRPGAVQPRRFLAAIAGNQGAGNQGAGDDCDIDRGDHEPPIEPLGSGRLELAHRFAPPGNPLAARVIVNRVWHHLIGRGIVATVDDFGVAGTRPTHPELLDHLATEFVSNGQSLKRLIRRIALSDTYAMSDDADADSLAVDPANTHFHFRSPRRLDGESIRDSLLQIAGGLDERLAGPPVALHLTDFMQGRGRPKKSGPLDGNGRRSIYLAVRRNFLAPFMTAFDKPVPASVRGRRTASNVPAQALVMLNDPMVRQLSRRFADRAMRQTSTTEGRIDWMYQTALSRDPRPAERDALVGYVHAAGSSDPAVWREVAHAVVNLKEFLFVR